MPLGRTDINEVGSMTKVLTKLGILVAGILLLPSLASAQYREEPASVVDLYGGLAGQLWKFHPAYGGPQEANGGAGVEQTRCATRSLTDGSVEVGCVYMTSNLADDNDRPWQCAMSVWNLSRTGISIVHDQVQVTSGNGNGDRPCGHPYIASTRDNGYWLIAFGRDATNGNTQPYMEVRSVSTLERIGNRLNLTTNNNNNVGAVVVRDYGTHIYSCFYDNDANRTYCRTQSFDGAQLTNTTAQTTVVTPADIGRPPPLIEPIAGTAFVCAAQGDNRPPEDGIYCRLMNTADNTTLWQGRVYDANPGAEMYYNMPYVADLGNNYIAVSAQRSNGRGKDNNNKGAAVCDLRILQYDGATFNEMAQYNDVTGLATHCSMTSGTATLDGVTSRRISFLGSPITGSGQPLITFLNYDEGLNMVSFVKERVAHAYNADSGKLSNLYGENPNTQGRDFHTMLMDVANPGYGLADGYMNTVKSFMVITTHGRSAGEPKNGGYIRFLPGETDGAGEFEEDCVVNPASCEDPPDPTPPVDEIDGTDDDGNPAPGNWGEPKGGSPGLFGCNVGYGRSTGGFALLLLAFALFVTLRRR
jgi:hypothetical protein